MPVVSLTITLTDEEHATLEVLANDQFRTPKQQAAWVLVQALREYADTHTLVTLNLESSIGN